MKINRLTEIIVILLNKKLVTAKELADRFEVSTRTIYRDIETLSMSGVPVYMTKGKGGGISLIEEYSIDKTILSKKDKESLIVALKTLQATKYPEINSVVNKIGSIFGEQNFSNWIEIDFTEWGSNFNEDDKFTKIKEAILRCNTINFNYVNSLSSQTNRTVETVVLLSHKKPDGHINVKVEFGEGEGKVPLDNIVKRAEAYKPKERVTYKKIKEYIEAKYGFKVHTAYIAEVKRSLGLPMYDAPNAVEELKQPRKHPTAEKVEAIKDALKYFEVI
ncbi:helix-turn-helix transcriptional regulator [Clostridioides difficile]|uniref:helix-turn-helix transcriptional regulator n=1 Tax=Clostridioides difficile TaxID=1496 RepID=UPI002F412C1A